MTRRPVCCLAADAVTTAADVMWRENIGPVSVVLDMQSWRLVGVITDRHLAVRVIAAGRDPRRTLVQEVMEKSVVTCRPEDDVARAVDAMTTHRLMSVPIVDDRGSIHGVVTQAAVDLGLAPDR